MVGGIVHPPIGSIYLLYTTYILPSGGLYATYHLLGEPETTIDSEVGHQHTELEHTPKRNLHQQAILVGIPFIGGLPNGCEISGCVAIFLE